MYFIQRFIFYLKILAKSNLYIYFFLEFLKNKTGKDFEYDFNLLNHIKIPKNATLIDIGAHKGETIKKLIKLKKKIYAFEPLRENFILLRKKYKYKNDIKIFNYGLGETSKKKNYLYTPRIKKFNLTSYSSISKDKIISRFKENNVDKLFANSKFIKTNIQIKKLDDFKLKPFFIKIDCEGSEYLVIKGSKKTLKKFKPLILIEFNKNNFFLFIKKILCPC